MSVNYEIERKFLVEIPEFENLDITRQIHIVQTYLQRGGNGSQRRVRSICENNISSFTYTEKVFVTPVIREENESVIDENRYNELIKERDDTIEPVIKTRYCFDYKNQNFEMDVYPFSDSLAVLELELSSPDQHIDFPPYVNILREISGDSRYSNASLATAGAFPDERNGENI